MLKSMLLFSLLALPLVAGAAPERALEKGENPPLKRTQSQKSETYRVLYDVDESEEQHYMLLRRPDGFERRTIVTNPGQSRRPMRKSTSGDPDVGTYYYLPNP